MTVTWEPDPWVDMGWGAWGVRTGANARGMITARHRQHGGEITVRALVVDCLIGAMSWMRAVPYDAYARTLQRARGAMTTLLYTLDPMNRAIVLAVGDQLAQGFAGREDFLAARTVLHAALAEARRVRRERGQR